MADPSNSRDRLRAAAIAFDPRQSDTPSVVAAGRGSVAEQILEIAFANGVKVREDADLVTLLSALDVDSPIPLEAFAVVAEILAYVYRFENREPGEPRP
ncbi:EscU/YscU/HrcU family type III secretion system export apparatus switch protein [Oceanibacterium hippocampi]|uniref:Flagellar biosynthetic protein FlhB n=1 Tax=Oceanibacterium hippocampi TaxID=745714 RepID=A0A1Y5TY90_9PROT|nr:EscU/YscU/HrcU family type III secretion system export apparatus switch protein [Oceanibacterium hippocampi]SLN76819.1 Flagellar biosynthetic protein FlhB [Oceanibacterium hippocampi]